MLVTNNPIISSIIGNFAAACECEHDGNVPISPDELRKKIELVEKQILTGL
jgi:hypothetical protein